VPNHLFWCTAGLRSSLLSRHCTLQLIYLVSKLSARRSPSRDAVFPRAASRQLGESSIASIQQSQPLPNYPGRVAVVHFHVEFLSLQSSQGPSTVSQLVSGAVAGSLNHDMRHTSPQISALTVGSRLCARPSQQPSMLRSDFSVSSPTTSGHCALPPQRSLQARCASPIPLLRKTRWEAGEPNDGEVYRCASAR
jgi:hypothetical protein